MYLYVQLLLFQISRNFVLYVENQIQTDQIKIQIANLIQKQSDFLH